MENYKVLAADEEIMKVASDTFFRQFVEWMNSKSIENNGWISVDVRLPEVTFDFCSEKVLIAQGVKDKQISFAWLKNGVWVTSDMNPFAKQDLITHWMPLPDKPLN